MARPPSLTVVARPRRGVSLSDCLREPVESRVQRHERHGADPPAQQPGALAEHPGSEYTMIVRMTFSANVIPHVNSVVSGPARTELCWCQANQGHAAKSSSGGGRPHWHPGRPDPKPARGTHMSVRRKHTRRQRLVEQLVGGESTRCRSVVRPITRAEEGGQVTMITGR
jgi:hypothetical protein